ncbi:hypothetical protein OHS58_31500 [Amycolatopsis sp. NBC_00348]|uniref:hypothetical protein n=1 Tax=Amycolatopsis sp. NBC_00348 TaxID=2975956 RepID=UPI002E25B6CE
MSDDEIDRAELGDLGERLGKGGQATVHLLPSLRLPDVAGEVVYKHYHAGHQPPHGLRAIVRARSKLAAPVRARLDGIASWPARVVIEQGAVCGVVMPLIPSSYFDRRRLPSGKVSTLPREVQGLFVGPEVASRAGLAYPDMTDRRAVCRDLAGALALLHENGLVFGDVNAKNALFRTGATPSVMLVDCDAVRIRGSAPVVRQLNAPDWAPPEGAVLTQATDLYKLGLFVLRTLSPGPQASTSRSPQRVRSVLDAEGRRLLGAALADLGRLRPEAAEWESYFATRTGLSSVPDQVAAGSGRQPAPTTTSGWRRDPGTGRWVPAL